MAAPASDAGYQFYPARLKAAGYVAGASIVATAAASLIGEDPEFLQTRHVWLLSVMCGLGLVLYGWFALVWLRELVRAGPVLEIDPIGILDRRLGPDPIPWSVVRNVRFGRVRGRAYLELTVDPPWPRRATVRISLAGLEARPDDVLAAIGDAFETRNRLEPLAAGRTAA